MHSPVLEAALYRGAGPGLQVLVSGDPPEAFLWLLRHMYRGPAPLPSLGLALQLALLAKKYQVLALAKQCTQVRTKCAFFFSLSHPLSLFHTACIITGM